MNGGVGGDNERLSEVYGVNAPAEPVRRAATKQRQTYSRFQSQSGHRSGLSHRPSPFLPLKVCRWPDSFEDIH